MPTSLRPRRLLLICADHLSLDLVGFNRDLTRIPERNRFVADVFHLVDALGFGQRSSDATEEAICLDLLDHHRRRRAHSGLQLSGAQGTSSR